MPSPRCGRLVRNHPDAPCKVEPAQTLGLAGINSVIQSWRLTHRCYQPRKTGLEVYSHRKVSESKEECAVYIILLTGSCQEKSINAYEQRPLATDVPLQTAVPWRDAVVKHFSMRARVSGPVLRTSGGAAWPVDPQLAIHPNFRKISQ